MITTFHDMVDVDENPQLDIDEDMRKEEEERYAIAYARALDYRISMGGSEDEE